MTEQSLVRAARQTHLPEEEPFAVVEQGGDGGNDDGALHVLGHVLEHRGQEQQHKHDHNGTGDARELRLGTRCVHDS